MLIVSHTYTQWSCVHVCLRVCVSYVVCVCVCACVCPFVSAFVPKRTYLVVRNNAAELPVCPDQDHCSDVALFFPLGVEVENTKLAKR